MNHITLLKQCGYDVTTRRAPPGGGRAVTHHALTCPTKEEMEAAIPAHQATLAEKAARERDRLAAKKPDLTQPMRSADLTQPMRSAADLTQNGVLTSRRTRSALYIEPSINPPKDSPVAGAPGVGTPEDLSPAPNGSSQSAERAAPGNASSPPPAAPPPAALVKTGRHKLKGRSPEFSEAEIAETDAAVAAYNEAAARYGFSRCEIATAARRKRLLKRIPDIGGMDAFTRALSAFSLRPGESSAVDWLLGRTSRFKLDLERLLQTDGPNLGDVLGKLIDAAGGAVAAPALKPEDEIEHMLAGPDGQRLVQDKGPHEARRIISDIVNGKGAPHA
jgi:hypothetical protein